MRDDDATQLNTISASYVTSWFTAASGANDALMLAINIGPKLVLLTMHTAGNKQYYQDEVLANIPSDYTPMWNVRSVLKGYNSYCVSIEVSAANSNIIIWGAGSSTVSSGNGRLVGQILYIRV